MKTDIYNAEGWVETWYDSTEQCIVAKWYKLTTPIHVRKSCEAQIEAARKNKVKAIVVETSIAEGVPYPEDQEWFGKVLFPTLQSIGVKAVITVLPQNALTKLGTKTWVKTGKQFEMDFIETSSLGEAMKYIKTI